jgi:hypothetical protein
MDALEVAMFDAYAPALLLKPVLPDVMKSIKALLAKLAVDNAENAVLDAVSVFMSVNDAMELARS